MIGRNLFSSKNNNNKNIYKSAEFAEGDKVQLIQISSSAFVRGWL